MSKLAEYKKAIAGFVGPGLALLVVAASPQSPGGSAITQAEWVAIVVACIAGGLGVGIAPKNADPS